MVEIRQVCERKRERERRRENDALAVEDEWADDLR
jgi:hypothetical protein